MTAWAKFRLWRRTRPFWGGLFLLLSAVELYFSGNLSLKNFQIHIGQQGFLIYLLPAIMLLCGVLVWVTPAQRLFYGIIGLLTALYSFLGLNLGGFFFGMLFGILGGALVIAWGPPRAPKPADEDELPASPDDEPENEAPPYDPGPGSDTALVRPYATAPEERRPYAEDPPTAILPGFPDQPEPPSPGGSGGVHRQAFVITLVPLLVAAGALALGHATPARADPACPKGMPSTSVPASSTKPAKAPAKKPAKAPAAKSTATPTPTPSASASGTGNPLVDGWNGLVDGLGHLLGIGSGDDPAASPTPSGSAAPPAVSPTPGTPGTPGGPATKPAPGSSGPASTSPSPSTPPAVPCLGARQLGKKASATGLTESSLQGGLLEGGKLTMLDSTYDGVVDLPTDQGSVRVLKFTMSSAVTEPFKLTIPEVAGHTTVINSSKLTIETDTKAKTPERVEFYTTRFQGNLIILGLPIPVVFTPDLPPPLTLAKLVFTDVKINLAFVNSQILTAADLKIDEN